MDPCSRLLKLVTGLTLPCSCVLGAALSAQSIRINGPLAPEVRTGVVTQHMFTRDGQYLVYLADRAAHAQYEIFGVPADASGPSVRLNAPLPPGLDVDFFRIGAGNRVVYVAPTPTIPASLQTLSVPADGSSSPALLASTASFWLNPAGDFVYFFSSNTLWRIPVDGSAAASAVVALLTTPSTVLFSDDGSVLLIVVGPWLYRKAADGSGPLVQLHQTESGTPDTRYSYGEIGFALDGLHAVFEVVEEYQDCYSFPEYCFWLPNSYELFSVPVDGSSAAVQLAGPQGSYLSGGFIFDASSSVDRVVFSDPVGSVHSIAHDGTQLATLNPPGWTSSEGFDVRGSDVVFAAYTATESSLLRAPVDGSQVGAPLFTSSTGGVADPVILAAGEVVFRGAGLYTVPLAGGTPLLLTPNHGVQSFLVHPDELTVVFLGWDTPGKLEVFRVPVDGSQAPLKLNATLFQAAGDVSSYSFTPDGLSVAYVADPLIDGLDGVFRAPLDGLGPVVQYNEPLVTSTIEGDVLEFQATGDGTGVVYRADEDEDERFDLFVAGTDGSGQPENLTEALSSLASVQAGFVLARAGDAVVFQIKDSPFSPDFSLHSAPTTPGPAPIELDSSASAFPLPIAVTPDGTRAVYRKGDDLAPADTALVSAPLNGSSPPVTLHSPFAAGRAVTDFQIDAISQFVVHRADEEHDGVLELFSVPLDGSAPPVRLHPPLPAGRTVSTYQISPDGRHVVFLADREVAGRFDLYSALVNGRSSPRKLDQDLLATRDVFDFVISPDGLSVVYRANVLGQNLVDIYRVPIEGLGDARIVPGAAGGSSPASRSVNGELREGRRIRLSRGIAVRPDYQFTADGESVLFRANPVLQARIDLFRVPSDGSSDPVQLSGPMVSGGRVTSFALSPDQFRIVYLADAVVDEVFELFRVPLAGGTVVRLDPLPSFADVDSYRIDPDSQRVVYRVDHNTDSVLELYEAPIKSNAPAARLNDPLPAGGDVEADFVPLPGGRTLYRADQLVNDVLELFVFLE